MRNDNMPSFVPSRFRFRAYPDERKPSAIGPSRNIRRRCSSDYHVRPCLFGARDACLAPKKMRL